MTTILKSTASKIAHNTHLPNLSLGGNKDLKALQNLITSEKAVLQSLQKLSNDVSKASESLRIWGMGEGEDLSDILQASTTLYLLFSNALATFVSHEHAIRQSMKAVRTREEALDDLKRRRKTVGSKCDAAEKKLAKTAPDHKSAPQQADLVNSLHDQIRQMDWEIISEEAKLGDFKRSSTKSWMMLKFGGLLECAEKATIVGELGRLVIDEIPLEETEPGKPRVYYNSHERVASLVQEAQRCVSEVVFRPANMDIDVDRAVSLSPEPPATTISPVITNEPNPFANPPLQVPQTQTHTQSQTQAQTQQATQPQDHEQAAYENDDAYADDAYADDTAYEQGEDQDVSLGEESQQTQTQYAPPPGLPPMPTGPPPQPVPSYTQQAPQPQSQTQTQTLQIPQQAETQHHTGAGSSNVGGSTPLSSIAEDGHGLEHGQGQGQGQGQAAPAPSGSGTQSESRQGIPESEVVYRERIGAEEGHEHAAGGQGVAAGA